MVSGVSPVGAHLVGSIPLRDAEQAFRTASGILGHHLRRLPDGETGIRTMWVMWQVPALAANPAFESGGAGAIRPLLRAYARWRPARALVNRMLTRARDREPGPMLRLRPGVRSEDIELGPLGYAQTAIESYAVFERLQEQGVLPAHLRFQVSLPTPLGPVSTLPRDQQLKVLPAYEARLLAEVTEMVAALPAERLAIQWDAAVEMAMLEGALAAPFGDDEQATRHRITEMLVRIGDAVPAPVELGYHLCYGDPGGKHIVEPTDTSVIMALANAVAGGLSRPLTWVHFPAPLTRSDTAYFAPLTHLALPSETEIYVGLVHESDSADQHAQRVHTAARALDRNFGVAAECGLGRKTDTHTVPALLRQHAQLATPLSTGADS